MKIQSIALAAAVLLTLATAASAAGVATEKNGQGNYICPIGETLDVTGQNCLDVSRQDFDRF